MGKIKLNSYNKLVGHIHDATLAPDLFESVQGEICLATGGVGSHVVVFDKSLTPIETLIFSSLGQGFAKSMEQDYFSWYHQFDDQRKELVIAQGPGLAVSNDDITPRNKRNSCPVYNEYFKKYESQAQLIYGTRVAPNRSISFSQARSKGAGRFTSDESLLYIMYADHLAKAIGIRSHITKMYGDNVNAFNLVSESCYAIVAVDENCKVVWKNDHFDSMITSSHSIGLIKGVLSISNIEDRHQVNKLVTQATGLGKMQRERCGIISMQNDDKKLILSVFSSSIDSQLFGGQQAVALLAFRDPSQVLLPPLSLIQSHFKLTPAEAKIALALTEGLTIKEYSSSAGITESTIRSTLKIVLEKTNSHRQVDLVKQIIPLLI